MVRRLVSRGAPFLQLALLVPLVAIASCAGDGEGLDESGNPVSPNPAVTIGAEKDNTLYEDAAGALSNGAGEHFFAGRTKDAEIRRGLIAFDIAGNVPAGATITDVTLTLAMTREASPSGPGDYALHKVTGNWGEGASDAPAMEGGGAPSQAGDATWVHTFYNTAMWTAPGGDFEATTSASQTVDAVGYYEWRGAQMVTDVQAWLDTPAANFGWVLIGDETTDFTTKRFDTHESVDTTTRPQLLVKYTSP